MMKAVQTKFKNIIYPHGKVHKNYGRFVGWSFISNFIISVESVMSTHSMLSVIGQTSSELTFSVNYIGKDIVGQLGGLYYMNRMGEKADKDSSKFINYSMFFQQSAILMECATPLLPISSFIPTAGLANIGKNISFTGIGAVNAKIISQLAEENNVGEIYAKISCLNTLGSTAGMGLGLLISAYIPDHTMRLGLMPFLAAIRIYTYRKSINGLIVL